jgi:N-acetylglucosaminyl-diphospho-decaprenol L-rhamnosyltransferase
MVEGYPRSRASVASMLEICPLRIAAAEVCPRPRGATSGPMTGPDPRVAIVIASRNRRDLLLRTLSLHLELPERPRVVLVDNASTDGTPDAVLAQRPGVEVIRLAQNLGGAARNVGMCAVDAPYVALCDDDSWWAPGALRQAADLFDRHPRLAAINAQVLVGPRRRLDPTCEEMARDVLPRVDGQPGHPLLSFVACGVVLRRSAVLDAGGFSPRFAIGGEEELLGWDLAAAGWQMSYVPDIVARHDPPPNDGRPKRRALSLRNRLWVIWLRRPLRAAAVRTLHELRRGGGLGGVARALYGLPWVLRERRVGPPHVEAMRRLLDAA